MRELIVKIKSARNGYIVTLEDGEEFVYQSNEDDEHEAFACFLRLLNDEIGPSDSRRDEKRIYVNVLPGDNHKDYEPKIRERFDLECG